VAAELPADLTDSDCVSFGRPNLPEIFAQVGALAAARNVVLHAGKWKKVAVFACGPPGMLEEARQLCTQNLHGVDFAFHSELFEF